MFLRFGLVLAIGFMTTLLLTPLVRQFCIKRGWYDLPEARRVHRIPTPRLGGVAIFAGFAAALAASLFLSRIAQAMTGVALTLFTLAEFGSASLAGFVAFASFAPGILASPIAGYVQGSILDIDGGQTRTL